MNLKARIQRLERQQKLRTGGKISIEVLDRVVNGTISDEEFGIVDTRNKIDEHLKGLSLSGDGIQSNIKVSGAMASNDIRLRQLLEKLDLNLGGSGKLGLGSNNLLFMACELLLLAQEDDGNKVAAD
jgi:putative ATP-dependent endonuclease of OLD family